MDVAFSVYVVRALEFCIIGIVVLGVKRAGRARIYSDRAFVILPVDVFLGSIVVEKIEA